MKVSANHLAWAKRKPKNYYALIAPGVRSDPKWQGIVRDYLFPAVARICDTKEGKHYGMADPSILLTVPGYTMDPWSFPESSKEHANYRYDSDFVLAMEGVIRALFPKDVLLKYLGKIDFSIRKQASRGFPYDDNDLEAKTRMVLKTFPAMRKLFHLAASEDWDALGRDYGIYFMIEIKRRFQVEKAVLELNSDYTVRKAVDKERKVTTPDMGQVVAMKVFEGLIEFMHAMRVRDVQAQPFGVNAPVKVLNDAMNAAEFEVAPDTTHASDYETWLSKNYGRLRGKVPIDGDLATMDKHVNFRVLDLELELMQYCFGLTKEAAAWIAASWYSPYICNGIWHERKEVLPYRQQGDPGSLSIKMAAQLGSGTNLTTNAGRIAVLASDRAALMKMGWLPRSIPAIIESIRWTTDYGVYNHNQSDDMLWWINADRVNSFKDEYPDAVNEAYTGFETTPGEPGFASYLSKRIVTEGDGSLKIVPDLVRGLAKDICPESSLPSWYEHAQTAYNTERMLNLMGMRGSASDEFVAAGRKFPAYGRRGKRAEYEKKHPLAKQVYAILDRAYDEYDPNVVPAWNVMANLETQVLQSWSIQATNTATMSNIDLEVLEEPDKAMFKYSKDQINNGVYTLFYSSIPAEVTQPVASALIQQ